MRMGIRMGGWIAVPSSLDRSQSARKELELAGNPPMESTEVSAAPNVEMPVVVSLPRKRQ
jgi:hypothetical protein